VSVVQLRAAWQRGTIRTAGLASSARPGLTRTWRDSLRASPVHTDCTEWELRAPKALPSVEVRPYDSL